MLLVKNEADIIEWCLEDGCRHLDHIYVLDNGSEDATWEIVQEMARSRPQIVPFKQDSAPFSDALRAMIFNHYKDQANEGDWWCRFDADEIFTESPRGLLERVSTRHHVVWGLFLNYVLTPHEAQRFLPDESDAIPKIDASNCPSYYLKDYVHSEAMLFKHRKRLVWKHGSWPTHMGIVSPLRPLVKHFRYRSPQQIQIRLKTRQAAAATGWPDFAHEMETSWTEKLRNTGEMHLDMKDGNYPFDPRNVRSNREPLARLLVKRVLHGLGIWP